MGTPSFVPQVSVLKRCHWFLNLNVWVQSKKSTSVYLQKLETKRLHRPGSFYLSRHVLTASSLPLHRIKQ